MHFHTKTTIDTLDYSGDGWNAGSKVVVACCGEQRRTLTDTLPDGFSLPDGFGEPVFFQKGILAINAPAYKERKEASEQVEELCKYLERFDLENIPLILIVDNSKFTAATLNNYVWVTYTRSNPSHDIYGVKSFIENKHWGCRGSLVIDARIKPHHAPELVVNEAIYKKVKAYLKKIT